MKKTDRREAALRLALGGLGTAVTVIFIALSYYLNFMTLSFTVLTSVGVMVPLSKDFYRESIFAACLAGVIGFFIANVKIVPYAMISGLYVVLTVFLHNKKVNVVISFVAKFLYSCLVFWIIYKVIGVLGVNVEKITFLAQFNEVGIYVLINAVFSALFLLYDWLLIKGYGYAKVLAEKIIKNNRG